MKREKLINGEKLVVHILEDNIVKMSLVLTLICNSTQCHS